MYEWSCSPLDASNNRYTLPDLGYEDDENVASIGENLAGADEGTVEIYPVPSTLNCGGTVSVVEFCYARRVALVNNMIAYGTDYQIFTLLTLERNGLSVEITNMIDVHSTPTTEKCTDRRFNFVFVRYCCDSMVLDMADQFSLPGSNIAFGIIPNNLLRYRSDRFPELRVEQYSFPTSDQSSTPAVGDTFTLTDDNRRTDVGVALFQFVISKFVVVVAVVRPLFVDG